MPNTTGPSFSDRVFKRKRWDGFLQSLSLYIGVPLVPLGIEKWQSKSIADKTVCLTALVYVATAGMMDRKSLVWLLAFLAGVWNAIAFGEMTRAQTTPSLFPAVSWWSIWTVAFVQMCQRFMRHVWSGEPLWDDDKHTAAHDGNGANAGTATEQPTAAGTNTGTTGEQQQAR